MGKKGEQMAAAATNAPAEDAGADDGGEGAGAATEVMGASLRNPDVHLAWLEPTPAEAELLAALEKEHPGMPGLCVPPHPAASSHHLCLSKDLKTRPSRSGFYRASSIFSSKHKKNPNRARSLGCPSFWAIIPPVMHLCMLSASCAHQLRGICTSVAASPPPLPRPTNFLHHTVVGSSFGGEQQQVLRATMLDPMLTFPLWATCVRAGAKLRFLRANSGAKEAKLLAVTAAAYKAHVEWEDTIKPREIGMADIQTSLDSGAWR